MAGLIRIAESLLRRAGLACAAVSVRRLAPGGNNRVYRVDSPQGPFLLKRYFFDPQDSRDRLGKEFSFLRLAWNQGMRCVPQPLAQDPAARAGLYSFIPGRRLLPTEVSPARVAEALSFYLRLNSWRGSPDADRLTPGSEASFSLRDHFGSFLRRAEQFVSLEPLSSGHAAAGALIREILDKHWPPIERRTLALYEELGFDHEAPLPREAWRLSPSDFGFHNALLTESGTLSFLDFEYSGWDDPAKMVCDFFLQPEVPVSEADFASFADKVAAETGERERNLARFKVLLPVHRLKWCCLLLNDFLPLGCRRRRFAAGGPKRDEADRLALQLEKAKRCLSKLEEDIRRTHPLENFG